MSDKQYIYTLTDTASKQVVYVGSTNNPKSRAYDHRAQFITCSHCQKPSKALILEIIEECDSRNRYTLERYWIWQFKSWGFPLKNLSGYELRNMNPKDRGAELSDTAKTYLLSRVGVFFAATYMGVKEQTIKSRVARRSAKLLEHDFLCELAKRLKTQPESLITQKSIAA